MDEPPHPIPSDEKAKKPSSLLASTPALTLVAEPTLDQPPLAAAVAAPGVPASCDVSPLDSPNDFWNPNKNAPEKALPGAFRSHPPERAAVAARPRAAQHDDALNILSFDGRLGRVRFLAWACVGYAALALAVVAVAVLAAIVGKPAYLLALLASFAAALFFLSLTVRRLHDINLSGWWCLTPAALVGLNLLLPDMFWLKAVASLVYLVFGLFLYCKGGSVGANEYGAPSPPNGFGVTVLALLVVFIDVGALCYAALSFD
ncbi:MAG: DUF805 domain-containing protein [Azoarcus sp.]|jgi:uncharacterized membrane protein YhaH (DUF805 family)|nr:DUF805 domain-containing protein [Azoarcus sp.]